MALHSRNIPWPSSIDFIDGLVPLVETRDLLFRLGRAGVEAIAATPDRKIEFVSFGESVLAHIPSRVGGSAYYPVPSIRMDSPLKAVLMDLDGTSVKSESFWIWIIARVIASLRGEPRFDLEEADLPHVSGHSVSEHLSYAIEKYCPGSELSEARRFYFEHTDREMKRILDGTGRMDAFEPREGLREFLLTLKDRGLRIGLVTSGLFEKAYPEILSAFRQLKMGDPLEFYDSIITAGYPMRQGKSTGTLGELSPKPHPWLYAEACHVGLQLPYQQRHHVIGLEDSAAGICSLRLAGFLPVGLNDGNIAASGCEQLCGVMCGGFDEVLRFIDDGGADQ